MTARPTAASISCGHPLVDARRFIRFGPGSFVLSEQYLSNECWKESRDSADWVIVTDIDEHLFHPAMAAYLRHCGAAGITLLPALGFQMISDDLPQDCDPLCDVYRCAAPRSQMMKPSIFDPRAIVEINFTTGRDGAAPVGNVRVPRRDEILLLHHKYLNISRTYARHQELLGGLGDTDLANRWGHKYSWSPDQFTADWNAVPGRRRRCRRLHRGRRGSLPARQVVGKVPLVTLPGARRSLPPRGGYR